MVVSEKNQYTLIKLQESSFIEFEKKFDEINSNHIIVILSENYTMNEKNISFFLEVAKIQKINNKSFIVVKNGIDIDKIPELLNITPTLGEAEDILEMEAIERDLFK
jgi:bifunctional ADP-heptose synthase (sugar kinase/adenylyltransferase)